jgi:hypothetical protein
MSAPRTPPAPIRTAPIRTVAAIAVAFAVLVVGACSVPRDKEAKPLRDVPIELSVQQSPSIPPGGATVTRNVYLVRTSDNRLEAKPRSVRSPGGLAEALESLVVEGVGGEQSGYQSLIPSTVQYSVFLESDTQALVVLTGFEIDRLQTDAQIRAIAQIVLTLTDNDDPVRSVRFVINNRDFAVPLRSATRQPGEAVFRSDYTNAETLFTTTTTTGPTIAPTTEAPPPAPTGAAPPPPAAAPPASN